MFINKCFDFILYCLTVPKCVSCRTPVDFDDKVLCKTCKKEYDNYITKNCSLCSKTLNKCICSNKYLEENYIRKLVKLYRYSGGEINPANSLIYSLKKDDRTDVLEFLAAQLSEAVKLHFPNYKDIIFTNVPRRKKAIIKYCIDHSELLAKKLAGMLGAKYYRLLSSDSQLAQKKTHGKDRIENVSFSVVKNHKDVFAKEVMIIDDIVTTGASMAAAANLVHKLGAKNIYGGCVAIAYKDKQVIFSNKDRFNKF